MDKHEWDFCENELYAIRYLEEHGFDVTITKRYISKDKLVIEKDGFKYDAEIPLGQKDINYKKLMPFIVKNWEMSRALESLRKEAKESGVIYYAT